MAASSRGPLAVLLLVFLALGAAYSFAVPLFEGPDEDDHFRFVKYLADQRVLPVQSFQPGGGAAGHQGWQPPLYYALAALLISPVDTSDLQQHLWRNEASSFQGERACCGRNLYFHTASEDFPYSRTTLAVHLARGLSLLFGALTVGLVYELALALWPGLTWLALAAAALVAFNPSFLFASALVSNDAPLAALCTLALLLGVQLLTWRSAPRGRNFLLLGTVLALGLLVKTTTLGLVPFALVAAAWLAWRARDTRLALRAWVGILLPIAVLAGWWFVRNQALYGDPLAYRLMSASAIFPREQPLTLPELFQISLPWLWQTFWGGPTPGDFPAPLLLLLAAVTAVASVGAGLYWLKLRDRALRLALLGLAGWLGFIFVAQVQFMRASGGTDQGRYLFPAIAPFALLVALGLREMIVRLYLLAAVRARARSAPSIAALPLSLALVLAGLLLSAWVLLNNTLPAYARPPTLDAGVLEQAQSVVNFNFSNQLALRGYSVSSRQVRAGATLAVTLYWTGITPMRESYRVFVHLVDDRGRVAGGQDVIPAGGAFATVLWQPGQFIADRVTVPINLNATPGAYQLEVGLYPFAHPDNRLNLYGSDEDRVLLDAIEVQP